MKFLLKSEKQLIIYLTELIRQIISERLETDLALMMCGGRITNIKAKRFILMLFFNRCFSLLGYIFNLIKETEHKILNFWKKRLVEFIVITLPDLRINSFLRRIRIHIVLEITYVVNVFHGNLIVDLHRRCPFHHCLIPTIIRSFHSWQK